MSTSLYEGSQEGLRAEAATFRQRMMELKLLNTRHYRDGALHTTVAAPAPQTMAPTQTLVDDRLHQRWLRASPVALNR
jgi:hypothetical protein